MRCGRRRERKPRRREAAPQSSTCEISITCGVRRGIREKSGRLLSEDAIGDSAITSEMETNAACEAAGKAPDCCTPDLAKWNSGAPILAVEETAGTSGVYPTARAFVERDGDGRGSEAETIQVERCDPLAEAPAGYVWWDRVGHPVS